MNTIDVTSPFLTIVTALCHQEIEETISLVGKCFERTRGPGHDYVDGR